MNILDKLKTILSEDFLVRFSEDELSVYIDEGLTEYARRSGAFVNDYLLEVKENGIVNLPNEVISVLSCGDDLPIKSWRTIASLHGGKWYNKTSRQAECYITDFDSCNQLRLFPIPSLPKILHVRCLVGVNGISFDKTVEAVSQYVVAMMMLRDYNGEASTYLAKFDELSRPPLVRTTSVSGIRNRGVWL